MFRSAGCRCRRHCRLQHHCGGHTPPIVPLTHDAHCIHSSPRAHVSGQKRAMRHGCRVHPSSLAHALQCSSAPRHCVQVPGQWRSMKARACRHPLFTDHVWHSPSASGEGGADAPRATKRKERGSHQRRICLYSSRAEGTNPHPVPFYRRGVQTRTTRNDLLTDAITDEAGCCVKVTRLPTCSRINPFAGPTVTRGVALEDLRARILVEVLVRKKSHCITKSSAYPVASALASSEPSPRG